MGFEFSTGNINPTKQANTWNGTYAKLKDFKKKHGNLDKISEEDQDLHKWLQRMRNLEVTGNGITMASLLVTLPVRFISGRQEGKAWCSWSEVDATTLYTRTPHGAHRCPRCSSAGLGDYWDHWTLTDDVVVYGNAGEYLASSLRPHPVFIIIYPPKLCIELYIHTLSSFASFLQNFHTPRIEVRSFASLHSLTEKGSRKIRKNKKKNLLREVVFVVCQVLFFPQPRKSGRDPQLLETQHTWTTKTPEGRSRDQWTLFHSPEEGFATRKASVSFSLSPCHLNVLSYVGDLLPPGIQKYRRYARRHPRKLTATARQNMADNKYAKDIKR